MELTPTTNKGPYKLPTLHISDNQRNLVKLVGLLAIALIALSIASYYNNFLNMSGKVYLLAPGSTIGGIALCFIIAILSIAKRTLPKSDTTPISTPSSLIGVDSVDGPPVDGVDGPPVVVDDAIKSDLQNYLQKKLTQDVITMINQVSVEQEECEKLNMILYNTNNDVDDGQGNRVFSFIDLPKYIFKICTKDTVDLPAEDPSSDEEVDDLPTNKMEERFHNSLRAKNICYSSGAFDALLIPNAYYFEIDLFNKKYKIFAEERLDINPEFSAQDEEYLTIPYNKTEKAIRQLAEFILLTGYADVAGRNNPLLLVNGEYKIALIDLEHMPSEASVESIMLGLVGRSWTQSHSNSGLIDCMQKEHFFIIDTITDKIIKDPHKGLTERGIKRIKDSKMRAQGDRTRALQKHLNLQKWHKKHVKESETLIINDTMDFKDAQIKNFAISLIEFVNKEIKRCSKDASLRHRRLLIIEKRDINALFSKSTCSPDGANKAEEAKEAREENIFTKKTTFQKELDPSLYYTYYEYTIKKLQEFNLLYESNSNGYVIDLQF